MCRMVEQGYKPGSCATLMPDGSYQPACKATLRREGGRWLRLIKAVHLSRPEDYLSIYQSGCNHSCLKCHSHDFTQAYSGFWMSTDDIAEEAARYEDVVTVREPRERALMFTASDLCRHCGLCVTEGVRGPLCPGRLSQDQVVWSVQGWGPARNIVAFTGGDLTCNPEFYAEAAEKIKDACSDMWVLIETNGFGLTKANLEVLASGGVDSFWLDIKAYDPQLYRRLCGADNTTVLKAPELIVDMGFELEVLTLYIPGWVEAEEIRRIAELVAQVDRDIPFTVLAFFPAHKMADVRPPTVLELARGYMAAREAGLRRVKVGNVHVAARTQEELDLLVSLVGEEAIG